jgi:hypothetical protein
MGGQSRRGGWESYYFPMADGLAGVHERDNEKVHLVGGTIRRNLCNPPT